MIVRAHYFHLLGVGNHTQREIIKKTNVTENGQKYDTLCFDLVFIVYPFDLNIVY